MISEPPVSVIIPTYNRCEKLKRALKSVEKQSYSNMSVIIVDDNSDPPVEDWLDKQRYSVEIIIIRHDANLGAVNSRISGIERANGELIAFLDDDDTWKSKKIEKQAAKLNDKSAGMVYVGREFIANGTRQNTIIPSKSGDIHKELLCENFIGSYSCVMISTEVIQEVGLPDREFPTEQDWEWFVRISKQFKICVIEQPLAQRRGSGISKQYETKRKVSYPLFIEKYETDARSYGLLFYRYWKSRIYFNIGWEAFIREKNLNISRKYFIKSLVSYPLNYASVAFFIFTYISCISHLIPGAIKERAGEYLRWEQA